MPQHKARMEILSQLATLFLIVLGVIATGLALSEKHRDAAIWVGFAAAVCGCLWFCAWLQDYLWKLDAEEASVSAGDSATSRLAAELDSPIRRTVLVLSLKSKHAFSELTPFAGTVMVHYGGNPNYDGFACAFRNSDGVM